MTTAFQPSKQPVGVEVSAMARTPCVVVDVFMRQVRCFVEKIQVVPIWGMAIESLFLHNGEVEGTTVSIGAQPMQ